MGIMAERVDSSGCYFWRYIHVVYRKEKDIWGESDDGGGCNCALDINMRSYNYAERRCRPDIYIYIYI